MSNTNVLLVAPLVVGALYSPIATWTSRRLGRRSLWWCAAGTLLCLIGWFTWDYLARVGWPGTDTMIVLVASVCVIGTPTWIIDRLSRRTTMPYWVQALSGIAATYLGLLIAMIVLFLVVIAGIGLTGKRLM